MPAVSISSRAASVKAISAYPYKYDKDKTGEQGKFLIPGQLVSSLAHWFRKWFTYRHPNPMLQGNRRHEVSYQLNNGGNAYKQGP